MLHRTYHKM